MEERLTAWLLSYKRKGSRAFLQGSTELEFTAIFGEVSGSVVLINN